MFLACCHYLCECSHIKVGSNAIIEYYVLHVKMRQDMKTRLLKFIRNKDNSWFGKYAHRWPDAALPMAYAMACIEVVSQYSDKAGLIYKGILKAWIKPETNELYKEVISRMSNSEIKVLGIMNWLTEQHVKMKPMKMSISKLLAKLGYVNLDKSKRWSF